MKMPSNLMFLILAFLLSGCFTSIVTSEPIQIKLTNTSPVISATSKPVVILTSANAKDQNPLPSMTQIIPTATHIRSATHTPLPTWTPVIPTITPTFTPSPTPLDTLVPELALGTIQPLRKDPLNCDMPCFWGIIPGKTTVYEAKTLFLHLGFTPSEGIDPNSGKNFYTISYDSTLGDDSFVTFFYSDDQLVENIIIKPRIIRQKEGSQRQWIAFSPETLIKRYGSPSSVRFTYHSYGLVGSTPNIGIEMIMYFDTSNLIVFYSGAGMNSKPFCPMMALIDTIRLWLGPNPPNTPSFETVPLEKATSLTIDQFTNLMLGSPSEACFKLNEEAFP